MQVTFPCVKCSPSLLFPTCHPALAHKAGGHAHVVSGVHPEFNVVDEQR